jgi:hypothetical protein
MSVYLIVAYQTAGGRPLREAIEGVMGRDAGAEFRLLVPATRTHHLLPGRKGSRSPWPRQRPRWPPRDFRLSAST